MSEMDLLFERNVQSHFMNTNTAISKSVSPRSIQWKWSVTALATVMSASTVIQYGCF